VRGLGRCPASGTGNKERLGAGGITDGHQLPSASRAWDALKTPRGDERLGGDGVTDDDGSSATHDTPVRAAYGGPRLQLPMTSPEAKRSVPVCENLVINPTSNAATGPSKVRDDWFDPHSMTAVTCSWISHPQASAWPTRCWSGGNIRGLPRLLA